MLLIQLVVALVLALGGGDAPTAASPAADQVSLGEEQVGYQRPDKDREPHPVDVTWGELKGLYQ